MTTQTTTGDCPRCSGTGDDPTARLPCLHCAGSGNADTSPHGLDSARIDLAYALRQLREYGDIGRAIDALERVQEALQEA